MGLSVLVIFFFGEWKDVRSITDYLMLMSTHGLVLSVDDLLTTDHAKTWI